jgi:NitT/TauT family transport system ATP-binding protein
MSSSLKAYDASRGRVETPPGLGGSGSLLIAEGLSADFADRDAPLRALEQVSFSVSAQEFVCIVGPSGCGKSTLLRLLGGLLRPSTGRVIFEGQELLEPQRDIGFVFQRVNLMPWRTALANVTLPLELDGVEVSQARSRARDLLELVGLVGFEHSLPRDLSGGMAQRVALARALAHDPQVLLLDEPFAALDALTRERMGAELLRIHQARRKTVVMVTHSIPEAIFLADRVLVLSSRPGKLRLELPVPLPRPRWLEMTHTPEFGTLAAAVRRAIENDGV